LLQLRHFNGLPEGFLALGGEEWYKQQATIIPNLFKDLRGPPLLSRWWLLFWLRVCIKNTPDKDPAAFTYCLFLFAGLISS
jgi:hypothetical protein